MFRRNLRLLSLPFNVQGSVAVVTMDRGPVNVLNRAMLKDLTEVLEKAETDPAIRGVVLTSNLPGIFSAGLDIFEMASPQEENLRAYWYMVQEMWMKLYNSQVATVAAINGSAPAGGCMIACACDYRVMIDSAQAVIGLNETQLGLAAPEWLTTSYRHTMSRRLAELHQSRGDLLPSQMALSAGLVDELSANPLPSAMIAMEKLLAVGDFSRATTKEQFRGKLVKELSKPEKRAADTDFFVSVVMNPVVQEAIHKYIEGMRSKRA
eukprot:TRINITY_DN42919_c0_g1_i1.p1 TRINITY_DN42919_c0_g1~~TRINITY_DN42919_c0_g1_i1.p1  ORF type:complete len:284 (+),score=81.68 TRINITY_DN42919_c0_g1_i1:60-854(+)